MQTKKICQYLAMILLLVGTQIILISCKEKNKETLTSADKIKEVSYELTLFKLE